MVTDDAGEPLMTSSVSLTFTLTVIAVVGAGDAVIVNVASVPSVTGDVSASIVTCGVPGGEMSLSSTVILAEAGEPVV